MVESSYMKNPLNKFKKLYKKELKQSKAKIQSACCFSTIGTDGYPNARYLSLKNISAEGFIVTGPLSARKGNEVKKNPKVALTFWWVNIEIQVRIQGKATRLSPTQAEKYFHERSRQSQLTSWASKQGKKIDKPAKLTTDLKKIEKQFDGKDIPLPKGWGGFTIKPQRIEFLEFNDSRMHKRTLYKKRKKAWTKEYLQP